MTNRGSISKRALDVEPSATLAITNRANALRAEGLPVIGFGAGEPDFPTPGHIVEAAAAAVHDPATHRYSPAAGLPVLRESVADWTTRYTGVPTDPSQVVVTNGGKHAVYATCQVLIDPGDEVLLPAPYWVTYPSAIELAGGTPVVIPTDETTGFMVSVEALEAAVTPKTKMLIFVSPSNPTGAVYTAEAMRAIGAWAADKGIWVMTDEIYHELVYGGAEFASLPGIAPEIRERTVIVNGVAKTFAMTGWRVGWLVGPPEVAGGATRIQSHLTSNVNNVAQLAANAALTGPLDSVVAMREAFDRRRMTMHRMLNEIDGVTALEPEGAFYAFANMTGLLGRTIGGRTVSSTLDLAAALLEEANVAIVPGEAFGAPGYARLSFALGDDELVDGLSRIANVVRMS